MFSFSLVWDSLSACPYLHFRKPINFKKQNYLLLFLICLFGFSLNPLNAQVQSRPDINGYSPAERCELRNLMVTYLNLGGAAAVYEHQSPTAPFTLSSIHCYDNVFLTWHRDYLRDMENWLQTQTNGSKYVPLPSWDPATPIPCEFFNNTCGSCPGTAIASGFSNMSNQNPNSFGSYNFSSFLSTPTLCSYTAGTATPPAGSGKPSRVGSAIDNFALALETQHNLVHWRTGGIMNSMTSPAAALFWLWHGYIDDVYRKYQCDCQGDTAKDVYIQDTREDIGEESNNISTRFYRSPEIWVRNTQDVTGGDGRYTQEDKPARHQNPEAGQTNYIYVRIRNIGCDATIASDIDLRVYYSKASTGLSWPTSWNNYMVGPVLHGDEITASPLSIPAIPPGESYTAEIAWNPPDPAIFGETQSHICLLARIESAVDPMAFAESTSIGSNTKNNNNIAWKNTQVVNINPFMIFPGNFPITFQVTQPENHTEPILLNFMNLDNLDFTGVQLTADPAIFEEFLIQAEATGMERIQGPNGELYYDILEPNATLANIQLSPGQTIPVQLNFSLQCNPEGGLPCVNLGEIYNFNVEQFAQGTFGNEFIGGNNYEIRIEQPENTQCGSLFDVNFVEDAFCENMPNGAIGLNINAPAPYTIYWSNGAFGEEIFNLLPGDYGVTLVDAEGCIHTDLIPVRTSTDLSLFFESENPSCGFPNGFIKALPEGGSPPYSFSWSNQNFEQDIYELGFGSYTVTVYDSQQCQITGTVNLGTVMRLNSMAAVTNATYQSTNDGQVEIVHTGGLAPYTYLWDNGESGPIRNNLSPGNYSFTITDRDGCTVSEAVSVFYDKICFNYLEVNDNPIPPGTYLASDEVFSTGKILAGDEVKLGANNTITLENGFEVEWGGQLQVDPTGCADTPMLNKQKKE